MAEVEAREMTPSSLHPPRRIMRIRSPSPGFRDRSQTPVRGRELTPLMLFREKSCTPSVWRSITPFIQREDKEKTPFEIGTNIILQLASNKAIIDKALVCDISVGDEPPARYIISEQSVIDKAAVMDLSNVEIIYVEDDEIEDSDFRESETPESITAPDPDRASQEPSGSDDELKEEKKKKAKKAKKPVKKKEKKEKEDTPPKLKLDLGPAAPKVNKAKMFEQKGGEKPLPSKPPPKRLAGPLAAMKEAEEAAKKAEEERLAQEEAQRKAQEEAEAAAGEEEEKEGGSDAEEHGSDDEQKGMGIYI